MTTANSIGLAAIQTTVDSAQAAMTVQGQAIQAAVAAQGEEISANVASQAVAIAADTSTQLASAAEQIALTRTQLAAVQSSLAAATTSIGSEITAATSNITALQLRSAGKMVGYAQCEVGLCVITMSLPPIACAANVAPSQTGAAASAFQYLVPLVLRLNSTSHTVRAYQPPSAPLPRRAQHRGENGADSSSTIVLTCTFRKTRSDTFWVISHNADTRQTSGSSNWRIEVDGQPCTDRSNNRKGSIDAAFHGVGPNMHRPMYVRGICYRTANQAVIRPGNHAVRWRQIRTSGDSYWGWNSNSRIMVEVRHPLPRAALLLILASQAKFGVPLNTRVFLCSQRLKSCGCHR